MQQLLENPMISGYRHYEREPDAVCPFCGAYINAGIATVSEQMSASGQHCEECIDKLDTPENRFRWLTDHDLQAKFLEWFFAKENEQEFGTEAKATAKWFVDKWHGNKKLADECDGYLKDFISDEFGYAYTQWMLDTN